MSNVGKSKYRALKYPISTTAVETQSGFYRHTVYKNNDWFSGLQLRECSEYDLC